MLCLTAIWFGAVFILSTVWVAFRISNRHVIRMCKGIPAAQPFYPILGNTLMFTCSLEKMTDNLLRTIEEMLAKGQRAACFWIGPYPLVMVTDPDDVRKVLNCSVNRGKEMEDTSKDYCKYGLVTSPVDHWKVTRRHLNLSFDLRSVDQLIPVFNSTSRRLVAELSAHADSDVFNLMPHSMAAALRAICSYLYGPRTLELISKEEFTDLKHAVELAAELVAVRLPRPWLKNDTVFKLFYGREVEFLKTAFGRIWQIADTESTRGEKKISDEANEGSNVLQRSGDCGFQSILKAMRQLQIKFSGLTDQHVTEEMISFFVTGTDSIGGAVSSCLLALARYPLIQEKVFKEICSVLSEEEKVSQDDLKRLPYLDRVVKETLRYFTIVPLTVRSPAKDLDLGGYTLPSSKTVVLSLSAACMDPKYYPEPRKFDPDRFSTQDGSEDSFFLPFSAGPRRCIGKTYSMTLMKIMVIHVVRQYRLSTEVDICNLKKKFMSTMTSCDGYNVILRKRAGNII